MGKRESASPESFCSIQMTYPRGLWYSSSYWIFLEDQMETTATLKNCNYISGSRRPVKVLSQRAARRAITTKFFCLPHRQWRLESGYLLQDNERPIFCKSKQEPQKSEKTVSHYTNLLNYQILIKIQPSNSSKFIFCLSQKLFKEL